MLLLNTVLLQALTTHMPQTMDSAVYNMQQCKHHTMLIAKTYLQILLHISSKYVSELVLR